jgi:3-oxoacyl-[acyl-carrier protein] reductase
MKCEDGERRTALVVGGSRGIGRAIALRLAESGFDIWLTYQSNHAAAREAQAAVEALGRSCRLLAFDLADRAATRAALEPLVQERCPDALVYNAGIARDNLLAFMKDEEWDAVLRTNLDGFFNVTKPVIFEMIRLKRGRVVLISSVSGQIGHAGQVNYSASKAGLIGAARALAREVGRKNIFVNVVSPGIIETEMTAGIPKEQVLPLIPLSRFGTSEEVAAVVNFLCAERQMYVHGQVIGVNGGMAV